MAQIIKGDDLMLFDAQGKSLAFATSHSLSINADSADVSSKDSGKWKANEVNKLGWEITSENLAIIPTEWKTEQYCYEFHCKTTNGQELLVYIDSVTGQEDNILILLYSDNGVLTK